MTKIKYKPYINKKYGVLDGNKLVYSANNLVDAKGKATTLLEEKPGKRIVLAKILGYMID